MIRSRQLLPFLCMLFLLFSCRKKDVPYKPAVTYPEFNKQSIGGFSGFRLFATGGEIIDAALIGQYASEFGDYFYYPGNSFSDPAFKKFVVVNADSILNVGTVPAGELKRRSTGIYDKFSGKFLSPVNDTNTIYLHMGAYKIFSRATTPLGYRYFEMEAPAYIMKHQGDSLRLPIIRYIRISRRPGIFSFEADKVNNVVDPVFASRLGARDTVLLQSFEVVLKK